MWDASYVNKKKLRESESSLRELFLFIPAVSGKKYVSVPHFFAVPLTFLRSSDRMQAKVAIPMDLYGALWTLEIY